MNASAKASRPGSAHTVKSARDFAATVRGKLLLAFCALAAIVAALGLFGISGISGAGDAAVESYDKPVASIAYARLALAQFMAMEIALTKRVEATDPASRAQLDRDANRAAQMVGQYLRLTASRADSEHTLAAAKRTSLAVTQWDSERRNRFYGASTATDISGMKRAAAAIFDEFDKLVAVTAEDGLAARAGADASIETRRRIAISATVLALAVGGIVALLLARRLIRRENKLIAAKEGAEAASSAKTNFLANMSHELRTPLNAVIGFSEMIASEMVGPVGQSKYKEFAADILFSSKHLLQIVNHVLDISKLQWGKMNLVLEPTDLSEVLSDALRIARINAEVAGVAIQNGVEQNLPPVDGDAVRLRQVVLNLLSNAIKFTPAGGTVALDAHRAGDAIEVRLSDTGIGMAAADIPKALEPFQQVHADTATKKYGGTGLGLPLSKLFIEQHRGTFAIASEPGQGTTITIVLPISPGYLPPPSQKIAA